MWLIILASLLTLFLVSIYKWLKYSYSYWERRNIPSIPVDSLLFGNVADMMFGTLSLAEIMKTHYDQLAPHKFGGIYSFQNPILIARDPDFIRSILTKDYNHFYDRGFHLTVENEPLTKHLFNLTGDKWKTLRSRLSPIFSSAKVKSTLPLIEECVDDLKSVIDEHITLEEKSIDMKDILARFFIDVISSCFFGVQANSLHNPSSEFQRMGLKTFDMNAKLIIRGIIYAFDAKLANSSGIKSINDDVNDFFTNLVKDTVMYRAKNNIVKQDFLSRLMSLVQDEKTEKGGVSQFTDADIEFMAAQCFVFFLAGYETSSNALSFTFLEIARNLSIQNRLQQEIDKMWNACEGNISYESLQTLTYMDQVLFEAMRLYPAIPMLMRTCTQNYQVPDSDIVIEHGTVVYIPIYGLHHDATYYPKPEKFDPERFSEQNKGSIPQFAYLPFGEGPKICIGMRLALMELKLVISHLLRHYTFSISSKMELPVKIKKRAVLVCCDGGIWLDCVKRNVAEPHTRS